MPSTVMEATVAVLLATTAAVFACDAVVVLPVVASLLLTIAKFLIGPARTALFTKVAVRVIPDTGGDVVAVGASAEVDQYGEGGDVATRAVTLTAGLVAMADASPTNRTSTANAVIILRKSTNSFSFELSESLPWKGCVTYGSRHYGKGFPSICCTRIPNRPKIYLQNVAKLWAY